MLKNNILCFHVRFLMCLFCCLLVFILYGLFSSIYFSLKISFGKLIICKKKIEPLKNYTFFVSFFFFLKRLNQSSSILSLFFPFFFFLGWIKPIINIANHDKRFFHLKRCNIPIQSIYVT